MSSPLSLFEARAAVITAVGAATGTPPVVEIPLAEAHGRVLAAAVHADRDQPPFPRSTRDGFAVRAADLAGGGATLRLIGEVAAGATFAGSVGPGCAVEIMTGAPVPSGADAVVMIEHTRRARADDPEVVVLRGIAPGENIVPQGSELAAGALACPVGHLLDPASIALIASLGGARPVVFARPRVAIIGTGDELVPVDAVPGPAQIRDSNRHCLAALVARAGGAPVPFPIVRDDRQAIERALAEAARSSDVILVSGGVSMGKHDHVEPALETLAARVIFDGVAIRPGRPLVFGFLRDKPFFGLPGNPLSALVTFELFARAAIELCAGRNAAPLCMFGARMAVPHTQKPLSLTAFVPARFMRDAESAAMSTLCSPRVMPIVSQGSGDLGALAVADGFLVVESGVTELPAESWVTVLPK